MLALAAIVASNAQAAPDVAVPLAPSGKWTVEYEPYACALSRTFGPAPDSVSFGIKPLTLDSRATVVVVLPKNFPGHLAYLGQARITLSPSGQSITSAFAKTGAVPGGGRAAMIEIDRSDLPAVFAAASLTIESGSVAVSIVPTAGASAVHALETCETELAVRWGVDAAALAAIATPPAPVDPLHAMVTNDDYPKSALSSGSQGDSMILMQIGTDGKVVTCRTLQSAGYRELDETACRVKSRRARYSPARDKQGVAVPSWVSTTISFLIP